MRVAIASVDWVPPEFPGDRILLAALNDRGARASLEPWDDPGVDWSGFDLVVVRSTWDYARRREEFCAWADSVGERLQNPPAVVRWNTDKRYLADLAAAGIPTVETTYVEPGGPVPELRGEVVVKPTVSAGGRDTGRFGPTGHDAARALIEAIRAGGRTAIVQPYLAGVDAAGETAIVLVDGRPSHVLRKGAVLAPDRVAPTRDDELGAAEVMYDPELVVPGTASEAELALAAELVAVLVDRFGAPPLYSRVDLIPGPDGAPRLIELEAVEPNLYHDQAPGSAERLADAIVRRARVVANA